MNLVYVFDAYCGWSYGFAPTLAEVTLRHPGLPVEVVSGGLFTGPRAVPIREFGYVQGANTKIGELTGVEFGAGYERLIADGSFVMDSLDAARGMAALRQAAPDRAVELAIAVQAAFYQDGLSLSDPGTFTRIAAAAGLDPLEVGAALAAPAAPSWPRPTSGGRQPWARTPTRHSWPRTVTAPRSSPSATPAPTRSTHCWSSSPPPAPARPRPAAESPPTHRHGRCRPGTAGRT